MHRYLNGVIVLSAMCCLALDAFGQDSKEAQARLEADFNSKLQAYQSCLTAAADGLVAEESKTAESIADESHAQCSSIYGSAADAAIIFTASQVPKSGKLGAVAFSMEQMDKFKMKMRALVLKQVNLKRGQSAP